MLLRLANKVRAARGWVRALNLASQQKFVDALTCIEQVETLRTNGSERQPPKIEFDIHLQLLKTLVLLKLQKYEHALANISELAPVLTEGKTAEQDYLRAYLSMLAHGVLAAMPIKASDPELSRLLTFDARRIEMNDVPAHIVRNFPVPQDFIVHIGTQAPPFGTFYQ